MGANVKALPLNRNWDGAEMPLKWKVNHERQLVVTTATGTLGRRDFDDYLAAAPARAAGGYRVIFDLRAADVSTLRPNDLAAFGKL